MNKILYVAVLVALFGVCTQGTPIQKLIEDAQKDMELMGYMSQRQIRAEDKDLDTVGLANKYGYPAETHKVTTADGYILTVHRIPHGRNATAAPAEGRPVAWLQHGLLCSSSDWLMNTVEKALPYRLADAGYDVWLGNARGNSYSKEHVSLSTKDKEFWMFSWNEMGKYDVPAVIDYALNATGQKDLYWFGHSMGTTMFFTGMSLNPEYNSKIRLMSAFAPVAFTEHMISPIRLIAPYSASVEWILNTLGAYEFLPNNELMDFLGATICHQQSLLQGLCSNVVFILCGFDSAQLNTTQLPIILHHTPAGASVRSLVHYAQGVNSGEFRQYNHGKKENLAIYGQEEPPKYDVSKITAPVAFYWSDNDWLGVKSDVYRLAELLPNLVRKYRVPFDKFNHQDFLWAIDSPTLLYETAEEFMKLF